MEVRKLVSDPPLATFCNDRCGLTANVRPSGLDFEVVVIDAETGDEVFSTTLATQLDAELLAAGLMNTWHYEGSD